jgi:hypothetical protein
MFNGSLAFDAWAVDGSGNQSAPQTVDIEVQNQLVSKTFTAHVCFPQTTTCDTQAELPLDATIATAAAVHAVGQLTLTAKNSDADPIWGAGALTVSSTTGGTAIVYGFCGSLGGDTVECDVPGVLLLPNSGKGAAQDYGYAAMMGYVGRNVKQLTGSFAGDITWTLTWPQ